jgi:hypothetical protein
MRSAWATLSVTTTATNTDGTKPTFTTKSSVDPITLDVQTVTGANGSMESSTFDGFGPR